MKINSISQCIRVVGDYVGNVRRGEDCNNNDIMIVCEYLKESIKNEPISLTEFSKAYSQLMLSCCLALIGNIEDAQEMAKEIDFNQLLMSETGILPMSIASIFCFIIPDKFQEYVFHGGSPRELLFVDIITAIIKKERK